MGRQSSVFMVSLLLASTFYVYAASGPDYSLCSQDCYLPPASSDGAYTLCSDGCPSSPCRAKDSTGKIICYVYKNNDEKCKIFGDAVLPDCSNATNPSSAAPTTAPGATTVPGKTTSTPTTSKTNGTNSSGGNGTSATSPSFFSTGLGIGVLIGIGLLFLILILLITLFVKRRDTGDRRKHTAHSTSSYVNNSGNYAGNMDYITTINTGGVEVRQPRPMQGHQLGGVYGHHSHAGTATTANSSHFSLDTNQVVHPAPYEALVTASAASAPQSGAHQPMTLEERIEQLRQKANSENPSTTAPSVNTEARGNRPNDMLEVYVADSHSSHDVSLTSASEVNIDSITPRAMEGKLRMGRTASAESMEL